MGPNSGGGRRNQGIADVPRRALFSNKGGNGKGDKGKSKGKREPRPVFESQKDMDRAKGKGKAAASNLSPAEMHIAAAAARAAALSGTQVSPQTHSIWERLGDPPSYVHGIFCLTRDDQLALEPLLTYVDNDVTASAAELANGLGVNLEVATAAKEHLRGLGIQDGLARIALEVVGPRLVREADEREATTSDRTAAERALEWICSTSAEGELPPKLREHREVSNARRRQEDKNVTYQTKALLLGGQIDSTHIARIEKLGFPRSKAIQALAEAPDHELLPAVKSLLAEYLPLDLPPGSSGAAPATVAELREEVEAMQSIYGEDAVQSFSHAGWDGMELMVALPASGAGGGGGKWTLALMIPPGLPYPHVSPLLCPRHERLREANRPRLMAAMGEICRQTLGSPMCFIICEWLIENGNRFLVRTAVMDKNGESDTSSLRQNAIVSAVYRSLEESEAQKLREQSAQDEKARRMEIIRAELAKEEGATKPKDKIAAEIRTRPETAQFDLCGYEDHMVQQLVTEAFKMPLPCESMVRITFIVGGGKAVRGRYSETLTKTLGVALQDLGFMQNSAASCDLVCAGSFKGQHDTQRNQKLVHVFPRIAAGSDIAAHTLPAHETHEQACTRLAAASWADFVEEVSPWLRARDTMPQAEALMSYLREVEEELRSTDDSLRAGRHISEARRRQYDDLGGPEDVAERIKWLLDGLGGASRDSARVVAAPPSDGATLSFDAPSQLQEAARAMGTHAGARDTQLTDDDSAWLQRRVQQTRTEGEKLRLEFESDKSLKKVREALPAAALRQQIQQGIRESQVVLVEGDTGCGKSTQVPQFILEDWVARGEGGAANILMTQPRRISAIGVAERIAAEMDTRIGDLAGYSIRLESKRSSRTKILVCTTGVLLRRLECDLMLHGVTHIIVDECHERDVDTDFLLIILRDLLPKRPNLRVVLMSATVNAQIFKDYFNGCQSFHIPGRTFPVTSYYLENALEHTGFVVEPNSEFCRQDMNPDISHVEESELRTLYEKPEHMELLSGSIPSSHVLRQLHRVDPEKINFELVAAVVRHIHTKLDPPVSGKSPGAILVFVPGLGEIKKAMRYLTEESNAGKGARKGGVVPQKGGGHSTAGPDVSKDGLWVLPLHSMISVNDQRLVFKKPPVGARKVVVTTNIAETSITIDDVEYVVDCGRHKQTKYDPQNRVSMLVDCVETKANAKQRRGRAGRVKAGVCYHLVNVRKWRRMDDFEKPEMLRVPLDSLCLRVSLMNMGHPAKVLAKAITPPSDAAVLSSLQQLVELSAVELREKIIRQPGAEGSSEIGAEGWDREDQQRLMKAKLRLTPLGKHLAALPVDAGCGKLLVLGCIFGVPRDVCTLAAALSTKSPFAVRAEASAKGDGKGESDKKKLELAGDLESDQLLLVRLFERWEKLGKRSQAARSWCRTNGLDSHAFETVNDMRQHLLAVLVEQGFATWEQSESRSTSLMPSCISSVSSAPEEFERRRFQLMRTLLCAALWPNVMLRKDNGACFARNQAVLAFHTSSVLALQSEQAIQDASGDWHCPKCSFFNFASREECKSCWASKPLPVHQKKTKALRHQAFVYSEKVRSLATRPGQKSQTLCRDCCGVPLKALYLLGHRVQVDYLEGRMSLDGWIHCQVAARDAAMLLGLRRRLQDVLTRRLTRKSADPVLGVEDAEVVNVMTQILVLDVE